MANKFVDLPVPAGDGVGASVDTSDLAARKTITVGGTISSVACTIEVSEDGTDWAPAVTFTVLGKRTVTVAAAYMRVRISGSVGVAAFALNVDVGADQVIGNYSAVNVPAADGAGTALDISAFGDFMTVIVAGAFTGSITIQISEDGTDWAPCMGFSNIGLKSKKMSAYRIRVVRAGTDPSLPGTPTVTLGAVSELLGGGTASGDLVYRPGGVQVDNVYTSWGALVAARALIEGPVTVVVDDRITSPAVIPAGGPYEMTDTTLQGLKSEDTPTALTIADGASFTGLLTFDYIHVLNESTSSPVVLQDGDAIRISNFSDISCAIGADPMFDGGSLLVGNAVSLDVDHSSSIGVAVPNVTVIDMAAAIADTLDVTVGDASTIGNNTIDCNAAGIVTVTMDVGSGSFFEQGGIAGTLTFQARSIPQFNLNPARTVAPYTANHATISYGDWLRLNANAATFTQDMPTIFDAGTTTELTDGRTVIVTETSGTNGITLDGDAAETIDGSATFFLPAGATMMFISDGVSNWQSCAINMEALLNRPNTFTESQGVAKVTLTDSTTVATNAERGNVFEITLGINGPYTLGLPTNLISGFTYMWIIKQDGTGSRTLAYNAIFKFPGGVAPTLSTGASDVDIITAAYDGTNLLCVFQADFS